MNKLSKEKRDKLILVCVGIGLVLAAIYFLLIRPQRAAIAKTKADTVAARNKLQQMDDAIQKADVVTNDRARANSQLAQSESDLAFGDPNAWIYDTIRHFKENYKVDIVVNGQAAIGDVDMIPNFPYKQLKVSVSGTAYYHDLGKFIADFENVFPHARITNLSLGPAGGSGENREKLSFRMEVIALLKQNPSSSK